MKPIQLLMWQIRRSDGRNRLGSWYHCCIQVRFPDGTLAEYDLQVPRSGFLEVEHRVQCLCSNFFDSRWTSFGERLGENLAPLNVTIFAVRLLKSSSLEESDDQPSSASVTSQTIDSEGANTGSGTLTNPSED